LRRPVVKTASPTRLDVINKIFITTYLYLGIEISRISYNKYSIQFINNKI
jgi:hypothetical protein